MKVEGREAKRLKKGKGKGKGKKKPPHMCVLM